MRTLAAIVLASWAAYWLNRHWVAQAGPVALITIVPVLEECLKLGFAVCLSGNIWWVHFGFGWSEAIFSIWQHSQRWVQFGLVAAICSVVGHAAFGAITVWGIKQGGWGMGLILGSSLHMAWNGWVVYLAQER